MCVSVAELDPGRSCFADGDGLAAAVAELVTAGEEVKQGGALTSARAPSHDDASIG